MSGVAVSNRVIARNDIGRFRAACSDAAEKTVEEAIERGAKLSRQMAPRGTKRDPRTTKLKNSIEPRMLSRTQGEWKATARHALAIEKGAVPHQITGWVNFFWENEERNWVPGKNLINHPGNAAQPYLRPAYIVVMKQLMQIARTKYPG